jgi:predicted ATP-dependent endonuclease of OLD family
MKLTKLKLENFRGYAGETCVEIDTNLTAIIGKNDIGKSTILEALDIFFNGNDKGAQTKAESADFCVRAAESDRMKITCCFKELPDTINIDEGNQTTLEDELLTNSERQLEIVKSFKRGAAKPGEEILIRANFPTDASYEGILDKSQADLKKIAQGLGVWDSVVDQRKNAEIRSAIRTTLDLQDLEEQLIPLKKGDGKALWEKLRKKLPLFALFKSDRGSSDQDKEVQDPMKLAVDLALREVTSDLEAIERKVHEHALEVAQRTLRKLHEMDSELADDLQPKFKEALKWPTIFKLNLDSEQEIPLNKRGSGVRRLILLNFFRAEAERLRTENNITNVIYALEEPETSQHPSNQRMIVESLLEISTAQNSQVLLTTHVPALAELLPLQSLRFIYKPDGATQPIVDLPSSNTYRKIADTLGIHAESETAKAGAIVMVEGHSDVTFLRHTANVLKDSNHLTHTLEDKNIVPLITGGCGNLKHWVNLQLLVQLDKPHLAFMDSDKLSETDREGGQNQRNFDEMRENGLTILFTRKREAENYLCPSLVDGVNVINDYDDVKALANDKKVLEKKWPLMTAEQILERDQFTEDGKTRNELKEVLTQILEIVD